MFYLFVCERAGERPRFLRDLVAMSATCLPRLARQVREENLARLDLAALAARGYVPASLARYGVPPLARREFVPPAGALWRPDPERRGPARPLRPQKPAVRPLPPRPSAPNIANPKGKGGKAPRKNQEG